MNNNGGFYYEDQDFVKGILALGTLAGTAYAAYKLGEVSGEVNERFCEKYGDDEDERGFYDHMDEPDNGCIAPNYEREEKTRHSPCRAVPV